MRFDAFSVTFLPDAFDEISAFLVDQLGAVLERRAKGYQGYLAHSLIQFDGNCHGVLAWGGNSRFLVSIQGPQSQPWADYVQRRASEEAERLLDAREHCLDALHAGDLDGFLSVDSQPEPWASLTRADVCYDWVDSRDVVDHSTGLRKAVAAACVARPPVWNQLGDWMTPEGRRRGCTLYMGARSSEIQVRFYDKGSQLRSEGVQADLNLRRVEIQYRPSTKEAKRNWLTMTPGSFWLLSPSTKAVASHFGISVCGSSPGRYPSPPSSLELQQMWASVQYFEPILALVSKAAGPMAESRVRELMDQKRTVFRELRRVG